MPGRIFDYAIVSDWDSRLEALRLLAEPERWTYVSMPSETPLPILDSYVRYTFLRLASEGKVAETDDLACFNTGLLTPSQEEIFGVFTLSDYYDAKLPPSRDNRQWYLKTWARSGDRVLTRFASLPGMASYWNDPAELILDPRLDVQPNVDHILRDNLPRFPVELGGQLNIDGVPEDLVAVPDIEDEDSTASENAESPEPKITLAARNALDGAIKHSIRLAKRSYRVAVPQFHRGTVQLLLPLYLRQPGKVDLALTLERHGDWYRAATVLYPDWAYRHARLLSRPNSEWLGGFRSDISP